jgi:hypothetical protein
MKSENLETRMMERIGRKRGDVFLRIDFADLGGYDQVGRVLRGLVRKGRLLKLGYGNLYRAVKPPFSDKPVPPQGPATLTEALERLGTDIAQSPGRPWQSRKRGATCVRKLHGLHITRTIGARNWLGPQSHHLGKVQG